MDLNMIIPSNWKFHPVTISKNNTVVLTNFSKLDLIRLKYLARKRKRNIKGLFTQMFLSYIKGTDEQN